jgi:hypothetical protein
MSQVRYVAEGAPARYGEIRDITAQGRSSYAKRQARSSAVTPRGHLSAASSPDEPKAHSRASSTRYGDIRDITPDVGSPMPSVRHSRAV